MTNSEIYNTILRNAHNGVTRKQLAGLLSCKSTAQRRNLDAVLAQMLDERVIYSDCVTDRYYAAQGDGVGTAVFSAHPRGFGFLTREDPPDLFVHAAKTHGAFNGDTVLFRRIDNTADEAEILCVISRGTKYLVGTFDAHSFKHFVVPDDKRFACDVYVPANKTLGARHGQKVAVKINSFPADNRRCPEGEITEVLGYPYQKDVDMLCVARSYLLTQRFPDECVKRAEALPRSIRADDLIGRRDLRDCKIFTIDGADAKDLDDAVSVTDNGDGTFCLGVHIADVSHYVRPDDAIDRQAFERGTSVYFPQTVYPMLPTQLSNGICSLFQGVDRLTVSCVMTIDARGKVCDYDIFPSVINSCHRMTYTDVQAILDGDAALSAEYSDITKQLFAMRRLAEILQNRRDLRGNIEFETKEVSFEYDSNGNVVNIVPYRYTFAHRIIEEFMIVANETVAQFARDCGYPFVYRVHAEPDSDKLSQLYALMQTVGIKVKPSKQVHGSVLGDALDQAKNTPYFYLVNDVMLRTMQKAKYSVENTGHFGLASRCYCHFTSPIRRYPDLVVHRILKTALAGKMTDKAMLAYEQMTADCARQSNVRERAAVEAERKADDVKKCQYARTLLGQTFTAIISGVTERGIFAQLANTVEGFVSADKLGDVDYFADKFCFQSGSARYRLGDEITVSVANVDIRQCRIDFDLADNTQNRT